MKKLSLLLIVLLSTNALAFNEIEHYKLWNQLIEKHVRKSGTVDYIGFKQDFQVLNQFIDSHKKLKFTNLDEKEKKAVLINLYNASMIRNILKAAEDQNIGLETPTFLDLEINSIRAPGGNLWNGKYTVFLQDKELNLDNIEHDLLRGKGDHQYDQMKIKKLDPRIHVAVNCAALSCPPITTTAYTSKNLEAILNENMMQFVNSDKQFHEISPTQLQVNSIIYWYYSDFDNYGKSQANMDGAGDYLASFFDITTKKGARKSKHLKRHLNDRNKLILKFDPRFKFKYKWQINDIRNAYNR